MMQHYARVRQVENNSQITVELPILEETVVEAIYQLEAAGRRTDARGECSEVAEEHTSRKVAVLRAELKKQKLCAISFWSGSPSWRKKLVVLRPITDPTRNVLATTPDKRCDTVYQSGFVLAVTNDAV